MNIRAFTLNEIGGRKNLEDAILPKRYLPQDIPLFIVCDGVGGSSFGEVASDIATRCYYNILATAVVDSEQAFKNKLDEALASFQQQVHDYILTHPAAATTSTTLALLLFSQHNAYIAWCGDSKIYQLRNSIPVYKSKDHSLVATLVAQGVITEKEALVHPQRNVITRSQSTHTHPSDITYTVLSDIREDDWFLLCTDGLMEQFTEDHFATILFPYNPVSNYSEVIDALCRNNTKDNYSMYLLHINSLKKKVAAKSRLFPVLLLLLLIAGAWYAYQRSSGNRHTQISSPMKPDTSKSIMMTHPQKKEAVQQDSVAKQPGKPH